MYEWEIETARGSDLQARPRHDLRSREVGMTGVCFETEQAHVLTHKMWRLHFLN